MNEATPPPDVPRVEPSPQPPAPLDTRLIADYLAAAWSTHLSGATPADFAKANALAMRCLMELPLSAFNRITGCLQAGSFEAICNLMVELRGELRPDDPLPAGFYLWHDPRIGAPPPQPPPSGGGAVPLGVPAGGPVDSGSAVRRLLLAVADIVSDSR